MKLLSSLQSRIIIAMFIIVFVSTIAAMVLTGSLLGRSYEESVRRQLETTATGLITLGISDFSELDLRFSNVSSSGLEVQVTFKG
jgi:hypothetical protein